MLNHDISLDLAFQALADGNRRAMLVQLAYGLTSVSELVQPLDISLPAVMQHLVVLENSGFVRSEKVGCIRTCHIGPEALSLTEQQVNQRHLEWEQHFDRLDAYPETFKTQGNVHDGDHRPPRRHGPTPSRDLSHLPGFV